MASKQKRTLVYFAVFTVILVIYLMRATASGLWFDESIEFYFSRTLRGPVPGARGNNSLYDRILLTYQPPLYNWLMYVWLLIYDSEFWFRLAGVLVTLIGGAGICAALKEITDSDWAALGSAVYLLAGGVSEYALEAGEYNLLMCMMCWSLCFYLRAWKKGTRGTVLGFIVFACLAVYSQYGAVFLIVPMYVALLLKCVKRRENIRELVFSTLFAAAAAALLVYFFLMKQMQHQGSIAVSHVPVFAYGAIDIFVSFAKTFAFTFHGFKWIQAAAALPAGGMLLIALLKKDKTLLNLLLIVIVGWIAYYLLTACSFYGYNGTWNPNQLGTANIGGRYSLMFAPLLNVLLIYGIYRFFKQLPERPGIHKKISALALCLLVAYSAVGVGSILATKKKDDIREATQAWYSQEAYHSKTIINKWDDALFQFYLTHHPDYSDAYQQNIILSTWWETADAAQIEKALDGLGVLTADHFYYISKASDDYEAHIRSFAQVLRDHGFHIQEIYRGASGLFYAVRQ